MSLAKEYNGGVSVIKTAHRLDCSDDLTIIVHDDIKFHLFSEVYPTIRDDGGEPFLEQSARLVVSGDSAVASFRRQSAGQHGKIIDVCGCGGGWG